MKNGVEMSRRESRALSQARRKAHHHRYGAAWRDAADTIERARKDANKEGSKKGINELFVR